MNAFENMNDQMKSFTDLQAKSLEPMRVFANLGVDAMEQFARKNYEVMGDVVEFTVKQAHLPLSGESITDVAQVQAADTKAFGELLSSRSNEYIELANTFGTKAREAAEEAAAVIKAS